MLRTSLLYAASVFLAAIILIVSLFAATSRLVHASSLSATESPTVFVSPTPSAIDYPLPYPGVLPDSPLWFAKAIRDRILLWLTFNQNAKIERLLLYADKRIQAAKVLVEGGKPTIGVMTAIKAEKYLSQAVDELGKAGDKGENIEIIKVKLKKAIAAHSQIIVSLQGTSPELSAALKETASINHSSLLALP